MTKRVLGHGATCCGDCDVCQQVPAPPPLELDELFDFDLEEDDE